MYWTGHYRSSIVLILAAAANAALSTIDIVADPQSYQMEAAGAGVSVNPARTAAVQMAAVSVFCVTAVLVARAAQYI